MAISGRAPDAEHNLCPICGGDPCIDPSKPYGDATCAKCGSPLWFVTLKKGVRIVDARRLPTIRDRAVKVISEQLGVPEHELTSDNSTAFFVKELAADSLDLVQLVMEFEDELDEGEIA